MVSSRSSHLCRKNQAGKKPNYGPEGTNIVCREDIRKMLSLPFLNGHSNLHLSTCPSFSTQLQ